VTKGVEPGQAVVTDGADRLKDGAKVRLAGAGPPAAGPAPGKAPGAATDKPPAAPAEGTRGQGRRRSAE
jgi:hypothetical protein